jgi:hypothetical protein
LVNPGAVAVGSATRFRALTATGVLTNPGAVIQGSGERSGSAFIPAKRAGGKRNYIIQGKKFYLADWELQLLLQQLTPKRSEVQIVNKDDVKQISRKLWKRLKDTDSALDALTLQQVDMVVQEATIEYDEDDDLVMLLL